MKFSDGLIKTRKEKVKDVDSINADLLIRACYVDQLMAGVYTYLPLGLRVLENITKIIRDEMNEAGGSEMLMPALQPKENWVKTNRWETEDNLFRFESYYTKIEYALGATHEEVVMPLMKDFILSYRDLPKYVYQIQNKFRDEKRAKAGLLRGREFIMKDFYSFHANEEDLDQYYEKMKTYYKNIFDRCGIGDKTYLTFASGGSFSKFSHEYQTESTSGEDTILLCKNCKIGINKEVIATQETCPQCNKKDFVEIKAIEVGNIFKNKTKYTKPFNLEYIDENDKKQLVVTGCYGIGLGRVMGAIVEVSHDEKGIIWPKNVAPYDIHLINLGSDGDVIKYAKAIYDELLAENYQVLWDDRDETAGVKFADADLIGIPLRIVISPKLVEKDSLEIKLRNSDKEEIIKKTELNKVMKEKFKSMVTNV
jgi:prolyl-tRNA synthetase